MRIRLLTILIGCGVSFAQGQNFVSGEVMIGSFNMKTLKNLQDEIRTYNNLPLVTVSSFPAFVGYSATYGFRVSDRIALGPMVQFISTGSRLDYRDYSGSATIDQLAKCVTLATYFQLKMNESTTIPAYFTVHTGAAYTRLDIKSRLAVGQQNEDDSNGFYSFNYSLRPGFCLKRKIKGIMLQGSIGYEFQVHGKLRSNENHDAWLVTANDNKEVTAQWDGLRVGIGVTYVLK
jgi:hypothetical protein